MDKAQIEAEIVRLVDRFGPWTYDIPLPHGVWTRGNQRIPHTRLKRVVQIAADFAAKPISECRVLDLGCLDGIFSIEFALHGASTIGVEIRESNIEKARFAQKCLNLSNVSFVRDDVRNITSERYGIFDIIICSGILYHLDAESVFLLIEKMYNMASRAAIIDTHISLNPTFSIRHNGISYHGHNYGEHVDGELQDSKNKKPWSSYDNAQSLWLTRPSLVNALSSAGFVSVYECFVPAHLNFGRPGLEAIDRCTFVAVKGEQTRLHTAPLANSLTELWPEGSLAYSTATTSSKPIYPRTIRDRIRRWALVRLRRYLEA